MTIPAADLQADTLSKGQRACNKDSLYCCMSAAQLPGMHGKQTTHVGSCGVLIKLWMVHWKPSYVSHCPV